VVCRQRAEYYEPDSTTIIDAVRAFNDDLLAPLLADLTKPGDDCRRPDDLFAALGQLLNGADQLTRIQHFIAAIRSALVGDRGPKSFHAAKRKFSSRTRFLYPPLPSRFRHP
jgi:hypothetical protein